MDRVLQCVGLCLLPQIERKVSAMGINVVDMNTVAAPEDRLTAKSDPGVYKSIAGSYAIKPNGKRTGHDHVLVLDVNGKVYIRPIASLKGKYVFECDLEDSCFKVNVAEDGCCSGARDF